MWVEFLVLLSDLSDIYLVDARGIGMVGEKCHR